MKSILLLSVLMFANTSFAAKFTVDPGQGKTEFVAVGRPAMLRIKGEGKGPKGEVDLNGQAVSGTLTVPLDGLSTGISMRDEHMKKKYLEVEKFPAAELKLSKMDLPKIVDGQTVKDVPFEGELTLHGVKKTIHGLADVDPESSGYKVHSHFNVILSEYKIDIPTYAGIKVADSVEIAVGFDVKK